MTNDSAEVTDAVMDDFTEFCPADGIETEDSFTVDQRVTLTVATQLARIASALEKIASRIGEGDGI